ncbi:hypothetical protein PCC7424_0376 [Gloeothece citriformis PCC 7424]|uniref:Uncharacterized protein n=1 Tax=Gloeothece citriformis (strain PCC 7424) TaxID=65393 RepID=B7KC20_GLOC7|nr:hypothetical protein [Gloeothece citriformis]ACK68843.1 hypothetical protein PCC7424_0376 [Gloeothece citriformis PCC 7424]
MTSAIKDKIFNLCNLERMSKLLFCLSVLALSGLLSLTTPQTAWGIPLVDQDSFGGRVMAQSKNTNVPTEVVKAVRQDLSRRTNIPGEQLKLQQASQQTWPNGCLGLAGPDEFCTQALVEGWRVIMSYKDQTWTYRTDSQGRTLRLEN